MVPGALILLVYALIALIGGISALALVFGMKGHP